MQLLSFSFLLLYLTGAICYGQVKQQFHLTPKEQTAMFEKRARDTTLASWLGDSVNSLRKYVAYKERI